MTMYNLPNFCRVCLKSEKDLIDLEHLENEPTETLMTKLRHCVSEVEWSLFKPLMCHACIKRLNVAYGFKKQCVQSANVLKNYIALIEENRRKIEPTTTTTTTTTTNSTGVTTTTPANTLVQPTTLIALPNQQFIRIVVGPQQNQTVTPNSFQNVFLNVVPTTSITPVAATTSPVTDKDSNENIFKNINNTFQKFIPTVPTIDDKNVDELLTTANTEEVSIEVDPLDFGIDGEGEGGEEEENSLQLDDNGEKDWEDLITVSTIANVDKRNGSVSPSPHLTKDPKQKTYIPILPKTKKTTIQQSSKYLYTGEHFLTSTNQSELVCESCDQDFTSLTLLKNHFRFFHLGKYPFKCDYCYAEFFLRSDYKRCVENHKLNADKFNSLTLDDFQTVESEKQEDEIIANENDNSSGGGDIITCNLCNRQFNSDSGLQRHKYRMHLTQIQSSVDQHTLSSTEKEPPPPPSKKKKYFIKGMKNAKCDVCNREFSTQSYLQLHKKLHMRDITGNKYKVFNKNRYQNNNGANNNNKKNNHSDTDDDHHKSKEKDDERSEENSIQSKEGDGSDDDKEFVRVVKEEILIEENELTNDDSNQS